MRLHPVLRGLVRSGPTSLAVIASLAIGVGAVTCVLATAEALLWSPLPFPEPERLVSVTETRRDGRPTGVALANLLDFQNAETVAGMAAYRPRSFGLRRPNERTRVVQVGQVTEAFFRVVGVTPIEGRDFQGEDEAGAIIVSHGLGRTGEVLLLNEEPRVVVGVLPPGFHYPMDRGIVPVAFIPLSHADYGNKRAVRTLEAVARLADEAAVPEAEAELRTIAARLAAGYPDTNEGFGVSLRSLHEALTARTATPIKLLGAIALSLFLIVSVNVANVFLARRAARADELSLRRALGARAWDLFSLLFAESAVLAVAGVGLGLLLAERFVRMVPALVGLLGGGSVEPPALGLETLPVTMGLAAVLAGVFAMPFSVGLRARGYLIAGQVALGVLLVQTTLLLGQSFFELQKVDPGFDTERVVAFGIGIPEAVYDTEEARRSFHRRLVSELEVIPGVRSAGTATGGVLSGRIRHRASVRAEGENVTTPRRDWPSVSVRIATPGYFESLGVPLVQGRALAWTDDDARPKVALVNRAFERAHMKDGPLGRRMELSWFAGELYEIVGVVADARHDLASEPEAEIVLSMGQLPPEYGTYVLRLRAGSDEAFVASAARDTVRRLDARLQDVEPRTARTLVANNLETERLSLSLVAGTSSSAIALAAIGLHGLVLAMVLGRRREMAIRLALGARRSSIARLVTSEGLKLAGLGIVVGAAGFALAVPWLRSRLYAIEPFDPASSALTLLLLLAVAVASCVVPARRAAGTEIAPALRSE